MKRMISMVLLGATLTMGVAACGSDTKNSPSTAAATTAGGSAVTTVAAGNSTAGAPATTAAGTASGSAEVAAFCTSADTLAAKLKAGMSDPSKLADLTKEATDFVTKAAALSGTNPSDSAAIQACAMKVTKAVTPG